MRVNILKEVGEHALAAHDARRIAAAVNNAAEDVVTYDFGGVQTITFTFARILMNVHKKNILCNAMEEVVSDRITSVQNEKPSDLWDHIKEFIK